MSASRLQNMPPPLSRQAKSQIAQPEVGLASPIRSSSELTLELSQDPRDRRQTPSSDSYMPPGISMAVMGPPGPPPFPVDPSLDAWNNTSLIPLDYDGLLCPANGHVPLLHERPPLPGASGSTTHSPEFQLPSIRETDSVMKWSNDPTSPWTSLRNTGSTGQGMIYQPISQRTSPGTNVLNYRGEPSRSEASVTTTGQHPLDSTYGSRSRVSNSEGSLDNPNPSQGCHSVSIDFNGLHVTTGRNTYGTGSTASQDDHFSSLDGSSDTSQRPRASASLTCPYDNCDHTSKNNSEHK